MLIHPTIPNTAIQTPAAEAFAHGSSRTGSIMIEVIVASVLMASLAAIFVPGLAAVNRQRTSIRNDALLMVELNNVAEKTKLQPAASLKLSDWFSTQFPEATLTVTAINQAVPFQPDEPETENKLPSFDNGLQIKISMPSQHSGVNVTRSLTVWPRNQPQEGGAE